MATLASMNSKKIAQQYVNKNKEPFDIESTIYETPDEYDHWFTTIKVVNEAYGETNFVCYLPKSISANFNYAQTFIAGAPLNRIKSILDDANGKPFYRNLYTGPDGWLLI